MTRIAVALAALAAPASPVAADEGNQRATATASAKFYSLRGSALPARYQRWARESLMPIVSGRVYVGLRGCPRSRRAVGCVITSRRRTVFIRRNLPAGRVHKTLFHELGHLYDLRVMNNTDRRAYKRIFRVRRAWWGRQRPVAELFAESYSFCARFRRIGSLRRYASYGYDPSTRQHDRACRLIFDAARRGGPPRPAPRTPPVTHPQSTPPPQPSGGPESQPGQPAGAPLPPLPGLPIPLPFGL